MFNPSADPNFSPVTFWAEGYPSVVQYDQEIVRYCDTMHEMNDPIRHHEMDLYSADEAELIKKICDRVCEMTNHHWGRPVRPWMGPLGQMRVFRAVQAISAANGNRPLRIFELGCGSGYLGAMLIAAGHSYTGMDITQGFYLWQNRLFGTLSDGDFVEGVEEECWPYSRTARVMHMPWWHYATLPTKKVPQVDIVISDTALGEMHPFCLRFITRLSRTMLEESQTGLYLFSNVGLPKFHDENGILANFMRVGLNRVLQTYIFAHAIEGRKLPENIFQLENGLPFYAPSGNPATLTGREFMTIRKEEAPLGYDLNDYIGFPHPRFTE